VYFISDSEIRDAVFIQNYSLGKPMKPDLLIVDDDESVRESFRLALQEDYELTFGEDIKSTLAILKTQVFDLILLDIMLPDGSGLDLLRQVKRRDETNEVIMVTALQSVDTALEALKWGAYDYITKPFKIEELYEIIKRVLNKRALERENQFLREEVYRPQAVSLIGNSKPLQEMLKKIEYASKTDMPILIKGEIGTGRQEIAREIHRLSGRQKKPFVTVHCGFLSKDRFESELFGIERPEIKGKTFPKIGKLEFANEGTLLLEQADRLPEEIQEKLLRVFHERKMTRLDQPITIPLDLRVIASMNVEGEFRNKEHTLLPEFLQFLSGFPLAVSPLRDRPEDIPELIEYFLKKVNQKAKLKVKSLSKEAIQFLTAYVWPGNLQELENSIEMMVLFASRDTLTLEDIPLDILVKQIDLAKTKEEAKLSLKRVRNQFERHYIRKVLERTRGNQTRTAATLGLHRNTLIWKLKELDMEEDYKKIVKKRRERGLGFRNI
jgi:DNA-binding NtrC family response regulator